MYSTSVQLGEASRRWRLDSEYHAYQRVAEVESYLKANIEWIPLASATSRITTGHTPLHHDLTEGTVPFLTIDCVEPLQIHVDRSGRVTNEHADKELRRARLEPGDVVITIKRRIAYAAPVTSEAAGAVVNQDVAVAKPTDEFLPGCLAALLVSDVCRLQALRLQTEQINPYLSVPLLRRVMVPRLGDDDQREIEDQVEARSRLFSLAAANEAEARGLISDAVGLGDPAPFAPRRAPISETLAHRRIDAEYVCATRLEDIWPEGLAWKSLGDRSVAASLTAGATPAADEYVDAGIPIFKVGGLSRFGTADWLGDFVDPESQAARAQRSSVQPGDVLILSAAHQVSYIGKSGFVVRWPTTRGEARAVGELIIVRPADSISSEVLSSYLNLPVVRQEMQRHVRGQSAHLYASDIKGVRVPLVQSRVRDRVSQLFADAASARFRAAEALLAIKDDVKRRVQAYT